MLNDILALFATFFGNKLNQHGDTVSQISKDALEKISSSLLKVGTVVLLFGIGLSTVMIDLVLNSYANNGHLAISEVSAVGGGLALLPLLIYAVIYLYKRTSKPETRETSSGASAAPGQIQFGALSEAVSLYILDLVEERKFNRARTSSEMEQQPQG
jgi:hypothetical protein